MAKIKIHNLLYNPEQSFLLIQVHESKMIYLPPILSTFPAAGISIPLIIQTSFPRPFVTLSLTLEQKDLAAGKAAFQEGFEITPPEFLKVKRDVLLITLYGPHLGEYPGVACRLIKSLGQEGVEMLAMSASLNSCLLVIPAPFFPKARQALERIFEVPQG